MIDYASLLVHVDSRNPSPGQIAVATALGRELGAQLVGVYFDDMPELSPSLAAVLPDEFVTGYLSDAADRARVAEEALRDAARAAGVARCEWRAPAGEALEAAVGEARCADLSIVGQARPTDAPASLAAQLVAALVLESGRPVLIVPYVGAPQGVGTRILVAWDGGREAARAVADALPLLKRAQQLTVACVDPGAAARGADKPSRDRLVAWLHGHGIAAKLEHDELGAGDGAIGEWLLSRAADLSVNLLVMGGYGRARWRERVLGGATRTLLETMTVPVLMAH